jgi:Zn-dependent peptidase ImmA (M78 family)
MSIRTESYYRQLADEALARLGASEPPVPVESIVESLFIPIRYVNLPLFFTGATVYEDGLPVMVVNWAQPEHERRRAMAHMLGHVLLVLNGGENNYPRDTAPHEEADMVAKELMLPTKMVIEQARLWFNDQRYLSRLFGVDEEQMLARMRELGIIKGPQGVVWDY